MGFVVTAAAAHRPWVPMDWVTVATLVVLGTFGFGHRCKPTYFCAPMGSVTATPPLYGGYLWIWSRLPLHDLLSAHGLGQCGHALVIGYPCDRLCLSLLMRWIARCGRLAARGLLIIKANLGCVRP